MFTNQKNRLKIVIVRNIKYCRLKFVAWNLLVLSSLLFIPFYRLRTEKPIFSFINQFFPCNYTSLTNISSTEDDAVFIATTRFDEKVGLTLRSILHSRCKATIYVFTPEDVIIPYKYLNLNIKIVRTPKIPKSKIKSPHKLRWEWYIDFISSNTTKINRILHVDAFDSFFFGDPFSLLPNINELYFQSEDVPIKSCPYNKKWLKDCHPNVTKEFLRNKIVCSGSLGGGLVPFTQFVRKMVTSPEWPNCWKKGADQGDFNYILWSNILAFDFKVNIMNCSSGFTTMNYCIDQNRTFISNHQLVAKDSDNPIIFAHQYNRFPEIQEYINQLCPK